jgi:hypothetical protein
MNICIYLYSGFTHLHSEQDVDAITEKPSLQNKYQYRWFEGIGRIVFFFLLVLYFNNTAYSQKFTDGEVETVLLWNSNALNEDAIDQESFFTVLESSGFKTIRRVPGDLTNHPPRSKTLLIIPHTSARLLSAKNVKAIMKSLSLGLTLITDGESGLSRAMGIQLGKPVRVADIVDHTLPELKSHWSGNQHVAWIANFPEQKMSLLVSGGEREYPLAITKRFGKGECLYFAPLFDPISGKGFARFVNLPYFIVHVMHRHPPFRRQGADAYFDPGFRFNVSIDTLAKRWRQSGIRAIHAAAWYFYNQTPYDYTRLIKAAHQNGILVYAWLEWPYVGKNFWDLHPDWRQKNALLQDAHLDFLYLMDFQNPLCMNTAMDDLSLLLENDWDGIDIAEFSMTGVGSEALKGPHHPEYFCGFTPAVRADFKKLHGFDQIELFDTTSPHYWKKDSAALNTFYRYRVDVNNSLLSQVIHTLDSLNIARKRNWEMILTIADNSLHPEFEQLLGFDIHSTLELLQKYNLTLQVEDPYTEWTRPPERYTDLGKTYRRYLGDRPFIIDINVVAVHPPDQKGYSVAQPTGSEIHQLWEKAAVQSSRVCFYSESTVFSHDWDILPFTMAARAEIRMDGRDLLINTPYTVTLTRVKMNNDFFLDGKLWMCYNEEGILIPQGKHRLSFGDRHDTTTIQVPRIRLVSISDELLRSQRNGDSLEVTYSSPARCALMLSRRASVMILDGMTVDFPIIQNEKNIVVMAPPGVHSLLFVDR